MTRIAIIGDSHSTFWSGHNAIRPGGCIFPDVDIYHVGPATAHNLYRTDGYTSKFFQAIAGSFAPVREQYGGAVLCFGEIDCRAHVVRHAIVTGRRIEDAVQDTVQNYIHFIDWFARTFAIPVVIWGPGPSTGIRTRSFDPGFPCTGTTVERNFATLTFNEMMGSWAQKRSGIAFGTIFPDLVNADGTTRDDAHYDGCHVDIRHMDIAIRKLVEALTAAGVGDIPASFRRAWPITAEARVVDLAIGLTPHVLSGQAEIPCGPFTDDRNAGARVRLRGNPDAMIVLDLRAAFVIDEIQVEGRHVDPDGKSSLRIETGLSLKEFAQEPNATARNLDLRSDRTRAASLTQDTALVRLVGITLTGGGTFELTALRVIGRSFATTLIR
jgi:hypothetical protein